MRQILSKAKIGLCLFENPVAPDTGWAMEAFGSPRYIKGTGDLRSDTIWLTNIDSNTFYNMGLSRTPRLRSDAFLRSKLSSISLELGLGDFPLREKTQMLCQMYTAIMDFVYLDHGIKSAPHSQLNNGIRQVVLPREEPINNDVRAAAISATQSHVFCEKTPTDKNSQLVSFVMHRQSYAQQICSQPLPVGPWDHFMDAFPTEPKALVLWLESVDRPALVEVTINYINESTNSLVNYGSGAGYTTASANRGSMITFNDRRWMTSVELSALVESADITIHSLILGREFASSPINVPDWGSKISRSYAFGLYCENIWTSLTRSLDGKAARTPLAAWLHSIDRIFCLNKAKSMVEQSGLIVHGYGYGRITVQVDSTQIKALPDLALRLGLISPAPTKENIVLRPLSSHQSLLELNQLVIERRAHDLLAKMDAIAIDEAHEMVRTAPRPDFNTRQIL